MRIFLLLISLLMLSTLHAGVYQWTDANGNTVFGDSPPESAAVKEVDLPMLTVADGYSTGKKDKKKAKEQVVAKEEKKAEVKEEAPPQTVAINYRHFAVKSPKKQKAVRSNNGNVLVRLELEPALQPGHGIVVYLDGKQVASGQATVFSLKTVDRGQHSLFAVLHDQNNSVLKNTPAINFTLLRSSKR